MQRSEYKVTQHSNNNNNNNIKTIFIVEQIEFAAINQGHVKLVFLRYVIYNIYSLITFNYLPLINYIDKIIIRIIIYEYL